MSTQARHTVDWQYIIEWKTGNHQESGWMAESSLQERLKKLRGNQAIDRVEVNKRIITIMQTQSFKP